MYESTQKELQVVVHKCYNETSKKTNLYLSKLSEKCNVVNDIIKSSFDIVQLKC